LSIQESALYGELVLYLRDRAAELLAAEGDDLEGRRGQLDAIIRNWFFTPQGDLHGCAPRELIWAEQRGEPNPVFPEQLDDFFFDDCPICQDDMEDIRTALEAGEEPGWHWYHDDGGYPLIARYDPEGWDECWAYEEAAFGEQSVDPAPETPHHGFPAFEEYAPLPVISDKSTPEQFIARLHQPWIDPILERATRVLTERLDCPEPTLSGLRYRPVSYEEALSLLIGLYEHGVDVELLVAQVQVFPYENIALDWLSRPDENAAMMVQAMEEEIAPDDKAEMARFRHHRDFVFTLSRVIPPGARLWLQGWLDAVAHGSLARAVSDSEEQSGGAF